MTVDRMLVTALHYLNKYGWAVIPCGSNKKPLIKTWLEYQNRMPTEKEVRAWWAEHPEANIAVITGSISGLTVIDVDSEDGDQALWEILPDDFTTVMAQTASGGVHYYCQFADGTRNAARWIIDCDLRSEGGYVVAPPSASKKGNWEWINSPDDKLARVPDPVLKILSRGEAQPGTGPAKGLSFSKGTRDESMFSVANALIKGGMHQDDARQVLGMLAQQCDPPFSPKEVGKKLQSAITRQHRGHGEIMQGLREWVEAVDGVFYLKDVCWDLNISDRKGRQAMSNAANRLVEEGLLTKMTNTGCFRIIDSGADDIDFLSVTSDEIPFRWPLGVNQYFRLMPKNVCVVAGEPDAGKTAYLLNVVALNMKQHEIYYYSSEMGAEEFRSRLELFQPSIKLTGWRFHPKERDTNFADVIKPNVINIVDYLEIDGADGREFWRVGGLLKDIRDRLDKGAAIVAIQKNADKKDGHNVGLGGQRGLEKPRLYMTMNKNPNKLRLEKVKNWRTKENPNNLQIGFKLIQGCRFEPVGEWHRELWRE